MLLKICQLGAVKRIKRFVQFRINCSRHRTVKAKNWKFRKYNVRDYYVKCDTGLYIETPKTNKQIYWKPNLENVVGISHHHSY